MTHHDDDKVVEAGGERRGRRNIVLDMDVNWSQAELGEMADLTNELTTIPFCPWTPNPGPQTAFLLDFGREALYGGAVGGSKSVGILMAASQFLDVPGYAALVLRKSFADLIKPGALMDLAEQWWGGNPDIKFDRQNHTYIFNCPGGGTSKVVFGFMATENDRYAYQGGAYHFVGFDELTQHKERDYTYLFSRQRRITTGPLSRIPIRMRATSNPGGVGHEWVYKRFIARWDRWRRGLALRPKRNFHPATLDDNPHLDKADYIESLNELDPITRAQLLRGDWNIRPDSRLFHGKWFKLLDRYDVPGNCTWVRFWDMAATDPMPGRDPDYTVGALVGRSPDGRFFLADLRRWRTGPGENDLRTKATALHDTRRVLEAMEQEPGASGKIAIHHYRTTSFVSSNFRGVPSSGKSAGRFSTVTSTRHTPLAKILAAGPFSSHAEAGLFHVVIDGSWDHEAFFSEVEMFPDADHDDIVDAISGAVNVLTKLPSYGLHIDDANEDMESENQWRPEAIGLDNGPEWLKIARDPQVEHRGSGQAAREVETAFAM